MADRSVARTKGSTIKGKKGKTASVGGATKPAVRSSVDGQEVPRKGSSVLADSISGSLGNLGRKLLRGSSNKLLNETQGSKLDRVPLSRSHTQSSNTSESNKARVSSTKQGKGKSVSLISRLSRNKDLRDEPIDEQHVSSGRNSKEKGGLRSKLRSKSRAGSVQVESDEKQTNSIPMKPVAAVAASPARKGPGKPTGSWKFCISSSPGGEFQAKAFQHRLEWQVGLSAWVAPQGGANENLVEYAVRNSDHLIVILTEDALTGTTSNNPLLKAVSEAVACNKHMVVVYETQVARRGKPDARDYYSRIPDSLSFLRRLPWIPFEAHSWLFFSTTLRQVLEQCSLPFPNETVVEHIYTHVHDDTLSLSSSFSPSTNALELTFDSMFDAARNWVFEAVTTWHKDTSHISPPAMLIVGSSGSGKTMIIDGLCQKSSICNLPVVAKHYFTYDHYQRRSLRLALVSISSQLRLNVPGFREAVDQQFFGSGEQIEFEEWTNLEIFEKLIALPSLALPSSMNPELVVLDGLEECDNPSELASLIETFWKPTKLPNWLQLVITCSPSMVNLFKNSSSRNSLSSTKNKRQSRSNSSTKLNRTNTTKSGGEWSFIHIDAGSNNVHDLTKYLIAKLGHLCEEDTSKQAVLLERIIAKSQGSFLYCSIAAEELLRMVSSTNQVGSNGKTTSRILSLTDVEMLPSTLDAFFILAMGRVHAAIGAEAYQALLSSVLAAREPIPEALVYHIAAVASKSQTKTTNAANSKSNLASRWETLRDSSHVREKLRLAVTSACSWLFDTFIGMTGATYVRLPYQQLASWLTLVSQTTGNPSGTSGDDMSLSNAFTKAPALHVAVSLGNHLLSDGLLYTRFQKLRGKATYGSEAHLPWVALDTDEVKRATLSCSLFAVSHLQYHMVKDKKVQEACLFLLDYDSLYCCLQWGNLRHLIKDTHNLLLSGESSSVQNALNSSMDQPALKSVNTNRRSTKSNQRSGKSATMNQMSSKSTNSGPTIRDELEAVLSALQCATGVLVRDPLQLSPQLLARIPHGVASPTLQHMLSRARGYRPGRPWWMLKQASLAKPVPTHIAANLIGHKGTIRCAAFSIDGTFLATGSDADEIILWQVPSENGSASWKKLAGPWRGGARAVNTLCFMGNKLLAGYDTGVIKAWSLDKYGEPCGGIGRNGIIEAHSRAVTSVILSATGDQLVSASKDGTILFWSAKTLKPLKRAGFSTNGSAIACLKFSPKGTSLVCGFESGKVAVWNTKTGANMFSESESKGLSSSHSKSVSAICFDHDGTFFITGSHDKLVHLWDTQTGKLIGTKLLALENPVQALDISSIDSSKAKATSSGNSFYQLAVSCSSETTVRLYRIPKRKEGNEGSGKGKTQKSKTKTTLVSDKWQPVVVGSNIVLLEKHTSSVWSVKFSSNGLYLVSTSADSSVTVWSTRPSILHDTWKVPTQCTHSSRVACAVLSPDKRILATGSYDMTIRLWDAISGMPLQGGKKNVLKCSDWVMTLAFSLDGKMLVAGTEDGSVTLWNPVTGEGLLGQRALEGHVGTVTCVTFSPDSNVLASCSSDQMIRLWNPATGTSFVPGGQPLSGHLDRVNVVVFSPNAKILASGSHDGTIRLWNGRTGVPLLEEPMYGHLSYVMSLAFTPDSSILASGSSDKTIRLWRSKSGAALLDGGANWPHSKPVDTVVFSSDGVTLVGVTASGAVGWDVLSGECVNSTDLCMEILFDRGVVANLSVVGGTVSHSLSEQAADVTQGIGLTLDDATHNGSFQYRAALLDAPITKSAVAVEEDSNRKQVGPVLGVVFTNSNAHFMEHVA